MQYKYDGATIIKEDKLSLHFQTIDYSIVCLARDCADGFKVDWLLLPNEGFVTTNSPAIELWFLYRGCDRAAERFVKTNERIISYRSQPSSRTTNRRLPRRMRTLRARCGHVRRRRSTGDKLKNDLKFTALQRDAHACMLASAGTEDRSCSGAGGTECPPEPSNTHTELYST